MNIDLSVKNMNHYNKQNLCYRIAAIGFCLFLSGCANLIIPDEFQYRKIATADFDFASWQKVTTANGLYKIYIEGDGHAFDANGHPTTDPTPQGTMLRELAFTDYQPNVIYLARACQFVQHKKCAQKYWTTARFAPEIIAAQAEAVKQIAGNAPVILIGFSGGAQIAGLIAVQNPDIKVKKIITIAGNLDHSAWTEYHHVPALSESLDLNNYRQEFNVIPQIHYVGTEDKIMPPFLNRNFVADKSTVHQVEGAGHNYGWGKVFVNIHSEQ